MARRETFVPLEKRSKKEQRAYYAKQRGSWNGINPVTRVVPNKKKYNRKRVEHWKDALPAYFFGRESALAQEKRNLLRNREGSVPSRLHQPFQLADAG